LHIKKVRITLLSSMNDDQSIYRQHSNTCTAIYWIRYSTQPLHLIDLSMNIVYWFELGYCRASQRPTHQYSICCNPPLFETSTMSTPDEWRAQGRTWDSIPQSMKKIAEQILEVPENHASELLPSPHISINAMLKFPLPNSTLSLPTSNMQLYFSHEEPDFLNDTLVLSLKHLPIPTASIIRQLSADAPQAWLDG